MDKVTYCWATVFVLYIIFWRFFVTWIQIRIQEARSQNADLNPFGFWQKTFMQFNSCMNAIPFHLNLLCGFLFITLLWKCRIENGNVLREGWGCSSSSHSYIFCIELWEGRQCVSGCLEGGMEGGWREKERERERERGWEPHICNFSQKLSLCCHGTPKAQFCRALPRNLIKKDTIRKLQVLSNSKPGVC